MKFEITRELIEISIQRLDGEVEVFEIFEPTTRDTIPLAAKLDPPSSKASSKAQGDFVRAAAKAIDEEVFSFFQAKDRERVTDLIANHGLTVEQIRAWRIALIEVGKQNPIG